MAIETYKSVLSVGDLLAIRGMIDSTHAPDHVLDLIERIDINIDFAKGQLWIVSERTRRKRRLLRLRQMKSANSLD